jgi:integrase
MEAYQAALAGVTAPKRHIGEGRSRSGTVDAVVSSYLSSKRFMELASATRTMRKNILERFRREHPDKEIACLQRKHIEEMIKAKATPTIAKSFCKVLRALMVHCIKDLRIREDDPTRGIELPRIKKTEGFYTWTEDDITVFEEAHPVGTRARLAFALLLYTLQRRSDVVHLGRQHIRNGAFQIRQKKTGTVLSIPVHPDLKRILDETPSDHLTFITTKSGKPFTTESFGNWFHDMCKEAGLPEGASAHGLRKAGCRRLAEAGCSAKQIASLSGHLTLTEVQRYVEKADQVRLGKDAMTAMVAAFPSDGTKAGGKPS